MNNIGVYAPKLTTDSQAAPLICLRNLFDQISKKKGFNVTHLYRYEPVGWGNSLCLPRIPGYCEYILNKKDFDIVHFNSFSNIVNPKLLSAHCVLTYHGDVHWELPGTTGSRLGDRARRLLELAKLPQFDKVLAVSSDLGDRVRKRYGFFDIAPNTLYNGIDHCQFQTEGDSIINEYNVGSNYIFHVSNFSQKKNPGGILKSFEQICNQTDVELLICGGGWQKNDFVEQLIDDLSIRSSVTLAGYVPDDDLPALYRDAEIFLYPSLHETFGLPIIEAMACGTPVVTADRYAMAEIAGEAALTCDPTSPMDIADCLLSILHDPQLATELRKKGLQRSNVFNWESTADRLIDIYNSL
jgi:glycosyltransferase involved in cell wall biosynthesis